MIKDKLLKIAPVLLIVALSFGIVSSYAGKPNPAEQNIVILCAGTEVTLKSNPESPVCVGTTVQFSIDLPCGWTFVSACWTFSGGTPGTGSGATPSTTYNTPGEDYAVTMNGTAKDQCGQSRAIWGEMTITVVEVDLNIYNGGSDLDNGEELGLQGAEVPDEDEENVGACLLVNWDDDNADGKMNSDGTWTKNPIPDLTENPVTNEDNLAKLIPNITPLLEEGMAELHLVSGGNKIKLWSSNIKDSQVTLVGGKLSWDLSKPAERNNFEKLGIDGLWIEGIKKSEEKEIKFILKYIDQEGKSICDGDTVVATVVMVNLGNAVHRRGRWRGLEDRGHAAIVYKFIGECNKTDLSKDEKFLIVETSFFRVTRDTTLKKITEHFPWGCFTTDSVKYVDRLKIMKVAKNLADRLFLPPRRRGPKWVPWAGFRQALTPFKWNGKLNTIKKLRCDALVEVCYEKNGIEIWGMARKPEDYKINYDITDQTDVWKYLDHNWWPRSNNRPDNLEEHNDYDDRDWEDTLMPATQCGKVKPVKAATKFKKEDLCAPIGSKGGN